MIRPMKLADLDSVVDIHLSSFTGFFLSFMGSHFLREFYKTALLDESSIALVSGQGGNIYGFAVGTTEPCGFYRRTILKHWHRFLAASFIRVLEKPQTILRLLRRLLMTTQSTYVANEALLMSIAVNPLRQGRGMGKRLIEGFLMEVERKGASSISLTTDRSDNEKANRFYVQSGFICSRSFTTPEGRQMNEYRKYFSSQGSL